MNLPRTWLLLVAAPAEFDAVRRPFITAAAPLPAPPEWEVLHLSPHLHLAQTGIGKVNAALAAARLADPLRYSAVINLGICGSFPQAEHTPPIGSIIAATRSVYADEGVATPDGFIDCQTLGFPLGGPVEHRSPRFDGDAILPDPHLFNTLVAAAPPGVLQGPIATVSTCSGSDHLARSRAARTGALAEAMEGAAIGHALARCFPPSGGIPFCELRAVSNTTGDRAAQVWNIALALDALERLAAAIARLAI